MVRNGKQTKISSMAGCGVHWSITWENCLASATKTKPAHTLWPRSSAPRFVPAGNARTCQPKHRLERTQQQCSQEPQTRNYPNAHQLRNAQMSCAALARRNDNSWSPNTGPHRVQRHELNTEPNTPTRKTTEIWHHLYKLQRENVYG